MDSLAFGQHAPEAAPGMNTRTTDIYPLFRLENGTAHHVIEAKGLLREPMNVLVQDLKGSIQCSASVVKEGHSLLGHLTEGDRKLRHQQRNGESRKSGSTAHIEQRFPILSDRLKSAGQRETVCQVYPYYLIRGAATDDSLTSVPALYQ